MPSLIGNKINQVPTNGDLGTLAFQDSNAVNITGGMVDVSAGTAALPTLGTTGDPNTGVFFPAADTVAVATNGVERVRVDSIGNVGVGITPTAGFGLSNTTLDIGSAAALGSQLILHGNGTTGTTAGFYMQHASNLLAYLWNASNAALIFGTNNTERMRVDTNGNVLIGTTSAGTSAAKVIGLANATAPTTSPAGMGQLYVEGGALKFRGSSGTVTTIAPA